MQDCSEAPGAVHLGGPPASEAQQARGQKLLGRTRDGTAMLMDGWLWYSLSLCRHVHRLHILRGENARKQSITIYCFEMDEFERCLDKGGSTSQRVKETVAQHGLLGWLVVRLSPHVLM